MKLMLLALAAATVAQPLPDGYWPSERSAEVMERTQTIRLEADLSHLTPGERAAVEKLNAVGAIFQRVFELQRHPEAREALDELERLDRRLNSPRATQDLLSLYRLNQGPIGVTLDNKREPFLPVDPPSPGKNVYPWGVRADEIEAFLAANPGERASILDVRTSVRRATRENLDRDLSALRRHPVLDGLHPGLKAKLRRLRARPDGNAFYAVPYAVAYADENVAAHGLLNEAADLLAADDPEFAGYLRNRARDLLSNDYESGDAAWVTGRFNHLNAQIGAYETYDDELFGVKAFYSFNLLATRVAETAALRAALGDLQALENTLPYAARKRVRTDIPAGVYDVISDFGQSRGGNTATILPNEAYLARRYGRTILMRVNIMRQPDLFDGSSRAWRAAVTAPHEEELTADGSFQRTLWHEVGHYLGVDRTRDGRDLDQALGADSALLEEMKADLVSLFVAPRLRESGYYDDAGLRGVYASGVRRVLQNVKPRREQPYQTMQMIQWNWFMDRGVLTFDKASGELAIDYSRYHDAVSALLAEVLELQAAGDPAAATRFIDRWAVWDDGLHGVVAANIRAQQRYRFSLFRYGALGE